MSDKDKPLVWGTGEWKGLVSEAGKPWRRPTAEELAARESKESRKCPYCAESIKAEATVCRYCNRDITPTIAPDNIAETAGSPETPADGTPQGKSKVKVGKVGWAAIIISVLVLIGLFIATNDEGESSSASSSSSSSSGMTEPESDSGSSGSMTLSEAFCSDLESGLTPMNILGGMVKDGTYTPEKAADLAYGWAAISCPEQLKTNEPLRAYLESWNINPDA